MQGTLGVNLPAINLLPVKGKAGNRTVVGEFFLPREGLGANAGAGNTANGAAGVFHKHLSAGYGVKVNGSSLNVHIAENNRSFAGVLY